MSNKGAFIYQQIELTTAEWATNTTKYPASVWLFERLESGKFNMKLADGEHTFVELPVVMQDIAVAVKTNNATTYILTITTAAGSFDTPNLRGTDGSNGIGANVTVVTNTATEYVLKFTSASGEVTTPNLKPQNYTHPAFTAHASGIYKITVNNQGHVTDVVAVTKADITALGIPAQDTNTTYSKVTTSADGLMSKEDKGKIDGIADGANKYTHPSYTAKNSGLYKVTVDATGHISAVTAVTKEDITALGIPGQDTNTTYSVATIFDNGLMSYTDKRNLNAAVVPENVTNATTLTGLSINNYSIKVTLSSASALSFSTTPNEGWECMIDIKNSSASNITQPLPNAPGWQCDDTSITIAAGKIASISVRYIHGTYVVIAKGN